MVRDPIVEEIRTIREALAKEHGYDVRKIVRALQLRQAGSAQQPVSLQPKRLTKKQPVRKAG